MELIPKPFINPDTSMRRRAVSPTESPRHVLYQRSKTLSDVLPLLTRRQLLELQDALLESCLSYELGQDWRIPLLRKFHKYTTGRMRVVYKALLEAGREQIDDFSRVMAEQMP